MISNKSLEDHMKKLDKVLSKLNLAGFKVNTEKSLFATNETEYFSLKITWEDIMPLPYKVEAIKNIAAPYSQDIIMKCHSLNQLQ